MSGDSFRIPVEPFGGATPEITEAIRDRRYLREVGRQAAIFNDSFAEAMHAAQAASTDDCWRHLQSALFAGVIVNRLISPKAGQRGWPGTSRREAQRIAQARAFQLRTLLRLPEPDEANTPLYSVWRVRDHLEHIDERLDRVLWDEVQAGTSDWYISDGLILGILANDGNCDPLPAGMRVFVPRAGLLLFNAEALGMFQLDIDMFTLRIEAIRAQRRVESKIRGRLLYGGSQFIDLPMPNGEAAVRSWSRNRQQRLALLEHVGEES